MMVRTPAATFGQIGGHRKPAGVGGVGVRRFWVYQEQQKLHFADHGVAATFRCSKLQPTLEAADLATAGTTRVLPIGLR